MMTGFHMVGEGFTSSLVMGLVADKRCPFGIYHDVVEQLSLTIVSAQ